MLRQVVSWDLDGSQAGAELITNIACKSFLLVSLDSLFKSVCFSFLRGFQLDYCISIVTAGFIFDSLHELKDLILIEFI